MAPRRAQEQSWGHRSFSRERGEEQPGPAEHEGVGGTGGEAGASTGLGRGLGHGAWSQLTEHGGCAQMGFCTEE